MQSKRYCLRPLWRYTDQTTAGIEKMKLTRRRVLSCAGALTAGAILPARAQDLPARSLRILVGTAPGGSPDIISRLLAEKISDRIGQSIYIENSTSGGGTV